MGLLRALLSPFMSVVHLAGSMWNHSGDWGWHISLRVAATVLVFGVFLFFFVWAFMGFPWPLFGE